MAQSALNALGITYQSAWLLSLRIREAIRSGENTAKEARLATYEAGQYIVACSEFAAKAWSAMARGSTSSARFTPT